MEDTYRLEMLDICKEFPGVKALDHARLRVRPGTVHALMGENGAGKSTLMKCLFGIYQRDAGEILIDGQPVRFTDPRQAMENGVAMVHQELNQVLKRDVKENLWLGRFPCRGPLVLQKTMYQKTRALFEDLELDVDPNAIMGTLSVSKRQMAEIAKAVSYHAKILVLDEPTSSLTDLEVKHLFRIISKLKDRGCGIIYISHKMEEILAISDEVTVMRDGKYVSTDAANDLTTDLIIKKMVGRELTNRFPPKIQKPAITDTLLEVRHLTGMYQPSVKDVSFSLRRGEVLGIAGLVGARRTEVLEAIFGCIALSSGEILLRGIPVNNKSPKSAIANGFAMITEERRATGIFGVLSVRDNAVISNLSGYRSGLLLSNKRMAEDAAWVARSLKVKTPNLKTPIRTLSGGNQQKVILGRWLLTKPEVLLLDEPTRGIDVGAKYEIYQLILSLASEGKGIIMVSSEMHELMGICDRILVMSGGRLSGEVDGATCSQEEIMTLAAKYV